MFFCLLFYFKKGGKKFLIIFFFLPRKTPKKLKGKWGGKVGVFLTFFFFPWVARKVHLLGLWGFFFFWGFKPRQKGWEKKGFFPPPSRAFFFSKKNPLFFPVFGI